MSGLDGIKQGDMVARCFTLRTGKERTQEVRLEPAIKVTKACITVLGNEKFRLDGTPVSYSTKGVIRVPTKDDVGTWQRIVDERNRKQREWAEYENREDVQLAKRFACTDTDEWIALGLDRLRQIAVLAEFIP